MSPVSAHCPSCRGVVRFDVDSSIVTVCEYCQSAVARGDRGLEDYGKVVDLVDSKSPLDLGLRGAYQGNGFSIVGRAQIQHAQGGLWDEWYCAFDTGHWGWLAEAQGRFTLTFGAPEPSLPPLNQLAPGQSLALPGQPRLTVQEKGQATLLGAKGEMPYAFSPGSVYVFADCVGEGGAFATFDYSDDTPKLFIGHQVTLDDLGITTTNEREPEAFSAAPIVGKALECPNCRGSLDLVAPDKAKRIVCPYCAASCDITQGNLSVLEILDKERWPQPEIELGTELKLRFEEHPLKVCGFMIRSVGTPDTYSYFEWSEYLLYHPRVGFRWLTNSDGHWSFVRDVPADQITSGHDVVFRDKKRYRLFDEGRATVRWVLGEFYWGVKQGESVGVADYVNAPVMLSMERGENEINWSECTYYDRKALEKVLGLRFKTRQSSVPAANQLFPYRGFYKSIGVVLAMVVATTLICKVMVSKKVVYTDRIDTIPNENPKTIFSEPFKLEAKKNIRLRAQAPVNNSWVFLSGELINTETADIYSWSMPIEYYHGNSGGESWSEGSQTNKTYLGALPAGEYALRLSAERKDVNLPVKISFELAQGFVRWPYFWGILFGLFLIPLVVVVKHWSFEAKKWAQSSNTPAWLSQGDED